ncbi:MAG: OmpA family protein [Pedobacter sp.]
MKRQLILMLAGSLLAITTAASAGNREGAFSISPVVGGYLYDGKQHLDTNLIYGARAGYNFTKAFGVEALFDYVQPTKSTINSTKNIALYRYGGELLYHFIPDSTFVPYLAAGYAGLNFDKGDKRTRGAFDYGIGAKFFLSDNFALRADVRHIIYKFDRTFNNLEYTIGAYIPFGGVTQAAKPVEPPAPAPVVVMPVEPPPVPIAPVDSDGDGVIDSLDKCPDTPAGVAVDSDGCPLDSDKDGVSDYLDKCPGTPAGVAVEGDGCPLDSDKDGVLDYLDKCPGTPLGTKVDTDGCPEVVVSAQKAAAAERFCRKPAMLAIEFDTNKIYIKPQYHDELKIVGDFLRDFPNAKGEISGHTDNIGSKALNQKLSLARAKNVKKYIGNTFAIEAARIDAKGYGFSKPVDSNKTKAGRAKNRRIEANFTCE